LNQTKSIQTEIQKVTLFYETYLLIFETGLHLVLFKDQFIIYFSTQSSFIKYLKSIILDFSIKFQKVEVCI